MIDAEDEDVTGVIGDEAVLSPLTAVVDAAPPAAAAAAAIAESLCFAASICSATEDI